MVKTTRSGWTGAAMLAMLLLVAGCSVRSISNSGYHPDGRGSGNPFYQGELTEFDVLGIDLAQKVSPADIEREFSTYGRPSVKRGGALMVIQSGAMMPDEPMLRELDRYFVTTAFSGVPLRQARVGWPHHVSVATEPAGNYAMALRLAAARGGYETIYCYWGVLETMVERHATKAISWVPVIGMAIPDETQQMRIRLKIAVIDVKSGRWSIFTPASFEDQTLTASLGRESSDQGQVALLKERAYKAAVAEFVQTYAR